MGKKPQQNHAFYKVTRIKFPLLVLGVVCQFLQPFDSLMYQLKLLFLELIKKVYLWLCNPFPIFFVFMLPQCLLRKPQISPVDFAPLDKQSL